MARFLVDSNVFIYAEREVIDLMKTFEIMRKVKQVSRNVHCLLSSILIHCSPNYPILIFLYYTLES
jgi:hypothetical protein